MTNAWPPLPAPLEAEVTTPLVLLPGTLCDERVFAPLLGRLAPRSTLLLPLDACSDVVEMADRILRAAPDRFALLGFSLGGIVALEIAARAPDRLSGLALIGSNARNVPVENHPSRRAAAIAGADIGEVIALLWPNYVADGNDPALHATISKMAEDLGRDTLVRQTELALSRADSRPRLPTLAMPALVLAGSEDVIAPPEFQQELMEGLSNATLALLPDAGHFVLLEAPDAVATHVATWLDRVDQEEGRARIMLNNRTSAGGLMSDQSGKGLSPATSGTKGEKAGQGKVLQVERRDFTQLVPTDRPRAQSMNGFDDIYTDIVDYIVRCTHRIWDERDVGLIYTHYTHNCVAYTTLGTMYDRETHIRDTIQRLVEFPDRRGMAQQVLWRGDDVNGFYTSHMTHGTSRHTVFNNFGKPTGRSWTTRTVADCMILENKIYKEWIVRDNMGPLIQLGIDPHAYALSIAEKKFTNGEPVMDVAENRRLLGQYPPETEADLSIAHNDGEEQLLRDLHHIYNKRMFGRIHDIYAPNCQWHGPLMRELYGVAAVLQQTMRLVAMIPDGSFVPQHICSVDSEEGGTKYALRWVMDGHHLGYGSLGAPTGQHLFVMGVTHFHIRDGKIIDEWAVYDELSMLVQIKLAELTSAS
jgi:pimeloyl-ACP methyl ester carboxylesterase/predicted ester cyclase